MASYALQIRDLALVALVLVTSYTDMRYHRIRNVHTFPAMVLGLVLAVLAGGSSGLMWAAIGIAVALLSMGILFVLGVMKAGDVKLMMAFGALLGPGLTMRGLLLSFVIYLPVGIVVLASRGNLRNIWAALKGIGRFLYTFLHPALKAEPLQTQGMTFAPFGMVLGVAVLLVRFLGWIGPRGFFH